MKKPPTIDLTVLPGGARYEDRYGKWMQVLERVATEGPGVRVIGAPHCWVPLILYLKGIVISPRMHFECDAWLPFPEGSYSMARRGGHQREYVEHVCTLRPELVDTLWKVDCQLKLQEGTDHHTNREFILTTYNGYYRPEIREYMGRLHDYRKPEGIDYAVITNCSADKPYPAPLHRELLKRIPKRGWHLVIATGVLGVVPQELWDRMPLYDSGIANFWRCTEEWVRFLEQNHYRHLVVYTEFYSRAIQRALQRIKEPPGVTWVIHPGVYYDYLPLRNPGLLGKLREAVQNVDKPLKIKGLTPFSVGNLTPLS